MIGCCRGDHDSLEELVCQLKLSFLVNFDLKNGNVVTGENQRKNGQIESNKIISCFSSQLSNHNSKDYKNSPLKISSELKNNISKDDCRGNLTKRNCGRKKTVMFYILLIIILYFQRPVNYFYESNAQSSSEFGNPKQTERFLVKFRNSRLLVEFNYVCLNI